jgi:hypothetical protein
MIELFASSTIGRRHSGRVIIFARVRGVPCCAVS